MATRTGDSSIVLFGGALDTGNLGVDALATSVLEGFARNAPAARLIVFDNGWGTRQGSLTIGEQSIDYRLRGIRVGRRFHRPENLQTMHTLARYGARANEGLRMIAEAAAAIDISGGDSFTDMYGHKRFRMIELPKRVALRLGTPLVLLPQTFGPFRDPSTLRSATEIVRKAHAVWARDAESYDRMLEILGGAHDPERHHLGIDVAFDLSPTEPASGSAADELRDWFERPDGPVAGVNVSGLLWNRADTESRRDHMTLDYQNTIIGLTERLVADGARVVLVPHVLGKEPGNTSDEWAVDRALQARRFDPQRVRAVPTDGLTAGQAKWWISHCSWFTGARMHSTIAALSTGVPASGLAYSLKTAPVFATVGQADRVVDGRTTDTADTIDALFDHWRQRDDARKSLAKALPDVKRRVREQMSHIVAECLAARAR